jgi:hypothetical protein
MAIINKLETTRCFLSPDKKLQFYPIYKNASTFVETNLEQIGWSPEHVNIDDYPTLFSILRDPFDRWISGFIQEITNTGNYKIEEILLEDIKADNTSFLLDFLFEFPIFNFGKATELHINYDLHNIPDNKIVFFKFDTNLNFKLHHWLLGEGIKNDFLHKTPINVRSNNMLYNKVKSYFFDAVNIKNKEKLLEYLKPDYDFINSTKFY